MAATSSACRSARSYYGIYIYTVVYRPYSVKNAPCSITVYRTLVEPFGGPEAPEKEQSPTLNSQGFELLSILFCCSLFEL